MDHELEPIADDELLYRRIPAATGWYDPATKALKPDAFDPHKNDLTGLSVFRAKYKSVEQAARGLGKSYYVAVLRAGDLRQAGIRVIPQPNVPDGYDLSHAELPDLNSGNRKTNETQDRKRILAKLRIDVVGPFSNPTE